MKIQTKLFASLLILVSLISFSSCEDDPQPAIEYQTEGFIKGKIVGVSGDNSYTFNDDFSYNQYALFGESISYYEINPDGSYSIELVRNDFGTGGSARISLELSSAADTTPDDSDFYLNYFKESKDKVIYFNMSSGSANTFAITDFSFDATTGKTKGKYTLSGLDNSTDKNATVTGEFNVTAKKVVQ